MIGPERMVQLAIVPRKRHMDIIGTYSTTTEEVCETEVTVVQAH